MSLAIAASIQACDAEPEQGVHEPRECEATHEKIAWTATFETRSHDVAGVATVVDDCTIRIDMFDYDARGITVQVYGGLNGDFDAGFPMSGDLVRAQPYEGSTIFATIPPGKGLDDLDGLSIWCTDVGVSFGDGELQDPLGGG